MNDFGKLFLTASLIISPWLLAACGAKSSGGEDDDENAGGRSDLCRSICRQIEECGTTNRQECVQVCQGDELTSTAALQVIDECYSEEGCSATVGSCLTSGLADLEPGPAAEQFCADMADYFSECSATEFSVVECRSLYGSVASGYLSDVGECFEESCGLVENCITSVTERYQNANGSIIELATTGGTATTCPYINDGECDEGTFCDYGTDTADCSSTTACPYTNDGECDEGTFCDYGTDTADCSGTTACPYTNDGECDEGTYCDYGTDTADCSEGCCTAADSCGWASDGFCDCGGEFAWDAADCN